MLVNLVEDFEVVATARTESSRYAYKETYLALAKGMSLLGDKLASNLLKAVSSFVEVLDQVYAFLGQDSINAVATLFYSGLDSLVQNWSGYGWGLPGSVEAKMMVNIYGTKDPLSKLKIGGYREDWAGFSSTNISKPLFNIEIEGADHFDYIVGVDLTKVGDEFKRNEMVAEYVAQIIVNANSPDRLRSYLDELVDNRIAIKLGINDYKLVIL